MTAPSMMEALWESVDKTSDGKGIVLTDTDVEYLWHCGFIDTRQVPFAQWAAFFLPFVSEHKGIYILSRTNFLLIEDFRYKGPIREPFDFNKINEGYYTDQGLDELFELGIGPSVEAPEGEINQFLTALKRDFRDKNKLVRVDTTCKKKIGAWMDQFPSPLRRLELITEAKIKKKTLDTKLFQFSSHGVDAVNAMQASVFSMRPSTVAVAKKEALSKVTQSKGKKKGLEDASAKTTPLHKLRRSPRGTRG